jgi:gas vesicle protein
LVKTFKSKGETMDNRNGVGKFISGVFLGGLAGAAVAILYAPKSGEDTRMQIRETANQAVDTTRQKVVNAQEQAQTIFDEAQTRVNKIINELSTEAKRKTGNVIDASRNLVGGEAGVNRETPAQAKDATS